MMNYISDVLTVSFDNGLKDKSALCVTRKCGEKIIMLKMELGEQADILYRLLTEQMTKAQVNTESGYTSKSPSFVANYTLHFGTGKTEWGAEPGRKYYVLCIHNVYREEDKDACCD